MVITSELQPVTMRDRVAELIKEAMLTGKLKPGERIVELRLAKQLGLGTTSVREALFALERQGFVARVAHKGAYVIKLSREDRRQIYRVRNELEGLAVELLTPRLTAGDAAKVQAILDGMGKAARRGDLAKFYERDLAFHRSLWELSGNQYVLRFLDSMVAPLFAFYVIRTQRDASNLIHETQVHQNIFDTIRKGDPAEARRVMQTTLESYVTIEDRFLPGEPEDSDEKDAQQESQRG